ncbi:MAG: phosphotransferase enzyme family protein [Pseudomonadales bacterium]
MTDFYQLDDAAQAAAMGELANAALTHWGLQGSTLGLIKYRENAVFKVTTPESERFALRIHRYEYHTDAELRSELQWMKALAQAGVLVPELVPTIDDAPFVVLQAGGVPEPRQIDVFEWVDGEQLGAVEESMKGDEALINVYRTIGSLMARLHNQAVDWALPADFARHEWNIDGLVGEQPFWGPFWELETLGSEQRALLLEARDVVYRDLTAYQEDAENAARYSMIHADCVAENVMVDGEKVRLIDFDDAGFGWHLFDIATALYFEIDEDHFSDARDALIDGYRDKRSLPQSQVDALPLFFLARSFTYLGWVHTRSETQTAKELTPMLVEMACKRIQEYL